LSNKLDHNVFGILNILRVLGNSRQRDRKKPRHSPPAGKKPSFNFSDGDSEAHVRRGVWKPYLPHRRSTVCIPVEINKYDPGPYLCCIVVPGNPLTKIHLAVFPVDPTDLSTHMSDEPAHDRLIHQTFHCRRDHHFLT
jgi:hypothetical protein